MDGSEEWKDEGRNGEWNGMDEQMEFYQISLEAFYQV